MLVITSPVATAHRAEFDAAKMGQVFSRATISLLFCAESSVIQVAVQKFKDQDI